MPALAPPVQVVASGAPPFVQVPSGAPPFVVTTGPAPPITIVASGAPPITLFNADGSIWSSVIPGGAALLVGEANGWATDFLHPVDAERVALKTSGSTLAYAVNAFYQQAGTSPKMVYDVTGTLGWSPHNTCLQSQTFDNASWTKNLGTVSANAIAAPDATTTADAWIPNSGVVDNYLNSSTAATVTGVATTFSIYMKNGTLGNNWVQVLCNNSGVAKWFNLATGVVGSATTGTPLASTITDVGSGWYRLTVSFTALATSEDLYLAPRILDGGGGAITGNGSSPAYYAWGAQINRGTSPTAYLPTTTAARVGLALDYDPVTHAAKGLLCEPQATNTCLQSQTLDNATWTKTLGTVSANAVVAPDGTTTADAYIPNSGSVDCHLSQTVSITNGATTTASIYVKNGTLGNNWIEFLASPFGVFFNPVTGVLTPEGGVTVYSKTDVGNGWTRLSFQFSVGASSTGLYIAARPSASQSPVTGNGSSPAYYAWGAQLEPGTVATSYIPTLAATVTRAADQVNVTPASINYSATAGSWWVENYLLEGSINRTIIGQDGFTATPLYYNANGYQINGAAQIYQLITGLIGNVKKGAVAFQSADFAITGDGLAPVTSTGSIGNLLSPTTIYFGSGSGLASTHGYIRKVRYLPRRPTNAELQTMTA
jgi:hypothetical protein